MEVEGVQNEDQNVEKSKQSSEMGDLVSHRFIFGVIFSRCRDLAATVRAKALQTLVEITSGNHAALNLVLEAVLSKKGEKSEKITINL